MEVAEVPVRATNELKERIKKLKKKECLNNVNTLDLNPIFEDEPCRKRPREKDCNVQNVLPESFVNSQV